MTREEVKVANYFQEVIQIHGSPLSLEAHMTEFKVSLQDQEKRYNVASESVEEKAYHVKEHQKTFVQAIEALKDFQDEVVGLRQTLYGSLQQIMQVILEVHEQVIKLERMFFPSTVIFDEALDPFRSPPGVTRGGGCDTSTINALA